jgi:hypothetical protein
MSNLLRQLRDLVLVRLEESFQLGEASGLLLVKVASLVDGFLGRVALL